MSSVLDNMLKTMSTAQAAQHFNVHIKTIFRWIKCGKLSAKKDNGQWHVHIDEYDAPQKEQNAQDNVQSQRAELERADSEIQYLREQNNHLTQVIAMMQKNVDSLTQQLENKDLLLEDMRKRPMSLWERIKGLLPQRQRPAENV